MDSRADMKSEKSTGSSGLYAIGKICIFGYQVWRVGAVGAVSRITA